MALPLHQLHAVVGADASCLPALSVASRSLALDGDPHGSLSLAGLSRRRGSTNIRNEVITMPTPLPPVNEADGVLDEVQAWFLAQADREGWVYTRVLRQLVNKLYRDRDYLEKRKTHGRHTAYDYAVDRDQKALAWAIRALVRYTPADEKAKPEPPKPPRKPSRRLTPEQRAFYQGRPSWNGKPKRDWNGPDLPPDGYADLPPLWATGDREEESEEAQ